MNLSQLKKNIVTCVREILTWRFVLATVAGGIVGYAYYYYVGCASGGCPITSNPVSSIVWGVLFGALIGYKEPNK